MMVMITIRRITLWMITIHETWKMSMGCIGHMAMQSPEDDCDDNNEIWLMMIMMIRVDDDDDDKI